jgi:hypothetical protein
MMTKIINKGVKKHEMFIDNIDKIIDEVLDNYSKYAENEKILINLSKYKNNLSLQKNILEKCQDRDMMDEIDVSNFEKLIDESCIYIENIQTIVKKLTKNESKRPNKRTSKSKS